MPAQATRSDGLRAKVSSVEVLSLATLGTISGVSVTAAAGRCGEGTARVRYRSGLGLSFMAPGSATWGPDVDVSAGGDFLLEDGDDEHKWARVTVSAAYLLDGQEGTVALVDLYNALGPDDVSAAEASSGAVETLTLTLEAASPHGVQGLKAWLGSSAPGLELSDDNATWVTPDSEIHADVVELGDLAASATTTLYVRRTISAAASHDPDVLNVLEFAWDGA